MKSKCSSIIRLAAVGSIVLMAAATTPFGLPALAQDQPTSKNTVAKEVSGNRADLRALDPIINGKEMVVFGEADHFLSGIHSFVACSAFSPRRKATA